MKKEEIIKELKGYDEIKWLAWIEDILYYDIALPFDRITPDGDVLIDLADLLHVFNLSSSNYEIALVDVLNKLSKKDKVEGKLIRLLDVLVAIVSPYSKTLLKRLLFDKTLDQLYYKGDSVKSKVFQAMVRLEYSQAELRDLNKYFEDYGSILFVKDIAFLGNYLRYIYLHFSESYFFSCMTNVMESLQGLYNDEQLPAAITVIEDKIREFYFDRVSLFYHYLYRWLTHSFDLLDKNEIYRGVVDQATVSLNKRYKKYQLANHSNSEKLVAQAVIWSLNLITDNNYFKNLNTDDLEWLASFLNHHDGKKLTIGIVQHNMADILKVFYSYDNSTEPDIHNTYFLFRDKELKPYEKYKSLINMLAMAENMTRSRTRKEKRGDIAELKAFV